MHYINWSASDCNSHLPCECEREFATDHSFEVVYREKYMPTGIIIKKLSCKIINS